MLHKKLMFVGCLIMTSALYTQQFSQQEIDTIRNQLRDAHAARDAVRMGQLAEQLAYMLEQTSSMIQTPVKNARKNVVIHPHIEYEDSRASDLLKGVLCFAICAPFIIIAWKMAYEFIKSPVKF